MGPTRSAHVVGGQEAGQEHDGAVTGDMSASAVVNKPSPLRVSGHRFARRVFVQSVIAVNVNLRDATRSPAMISSDPSECATLIDSVDCATLVDSVERVCVGADQCRFAIRTSEELQGY